MKQTAEWPQLGMKETLSRLTAPGAAFEMETAVIRGVPTRIYKRARGHLREIFDASRTFGERDFLVYEGERISFEAHWRAASALGYRLSREFGIGEGDRVAICMRNFPEWSVAAWAILAIDAVVTPLNAWSNVEELQYCLEDSGAKLWFADAERLARFAEAGVVPAAATIGVRAGDVANVIRLESLIGTTADYANLPDAPLPVIPMDPDSHATLFYTSGTTGRSKGVIGTHRNIASGLVDVRYRVARAALRRGQAYVEAPPAAQRAILLPVPLFHITGFNVMLTPALEEGRKIVLMYKWDPAAAADLIESEKINGMTAVPTMYRQLLELEDLGAHDLSSIDALSVGGAAAGPHLMSRIAAAFPRAAVGQGYGATETAMAIASNSAEDQRARPESAGPPCPSCEIRVVGEDGAEVAPGEPGELWVKGPSVSPGYWNDPVNTAASFHDGWYRTGDIVRVDEDQFIEILDRVKDMIIRGGENIHCGEVEDVLRRHPAVADAAVVGLPDELLGEKVAASVLLFEETSVAELEAHAAAILPKHKRPAVLHIATAPFPSNAAGKTLKRQIRDELVTLYAAPVPATS